MVVVYRPEIKDTSLEKMTIEKQITIYAEDIKDNKILVLQKKLCACFHFQFLTSETECMACEKA